jgi:hypothetical protein
MKKYELLTKNVKYVDGHKLYRIMSLREVRTQYGIVLCGAFGGYVEHENNLINDESDNSWIFCYGKVYDNAVIKDDTIITDYARVYGDAICTRSSISGNSRIFDSAKVNKSDISGSAHIFGKAQVSNVVLGGKSNISGDAVIALDNERNMIFRDVRINGGVYTTYIYGADDTPPYLISNTLELLQVF